MTWLGPIVLPHDVQIVPLSQLSPELRSQLQGEDGDFAMTRPNSRVLSKIIAKDAAELLKRFEKPITIVDAIRQYSKDVNAAPQDVLEEAYPVIESCLLSKLLVHPGEAMEAIRPSLKRGDTVAGHQVEEWVQTLEDSEVFRVSTAEGAAGAMKISRGAKAGHTPALFAREARILTSLDGRVNPRLLGRGYAEDGRAFLITEWCYGDHCQEAIQAIRNRTGQICSVELLELCAAVLDAYAHLHAQGILHSDVHPRNVLVSEDGAIKIIDYGVSRFDANADVAAPRAGMPFFYEPEYAAAVLRNEPIPASTQIGEQYALGALLYFLITGNHYLDFSFEKKTMLQQIINDLPVPMVGREIRGIEEAEAAVRRALKKDPQKRYATTRDFAAAFRSAIPTTAINPLPILRDGDVLRKLLDSMLQKVADPDDLFIFNRTDSPSASVTYGAAGVAYALYRVACARDDAKLIPLADRWAERAAGEIGQDAAFYCSKLDISPETVGLVSPYHTPSGIAAVQTSLAFCRGDFAGVNRHLGRFVELASGHCDGLDLTLGRSGVLLGLASLMPLSGVAADLLAEHGNTLAENIWRELEAKPAIADLPKNEYLGMAHGWAGLLYAQLRWSAVAEKPPRDAVGARLEELADMAQVTPRRARWPVQVGSERVYMCGWCNGSAGYVHLWTLAHRLFGCERFLTLAEKAGFDVYIGVDGGHALCCGLAGQAYSMLTLHRHTGNRVWLERAKELAVRAATYSMQSGFQNKESLPFSLYKGCLGVGLLAAELKNPEFASMPFFEAELWSKGSERNR